MRILVPVLVILSLSLTTYVVRHNFAAKPHGSQAEVPVFVVVLIGDIHHCHKAIDSC